MNEKIVYLYVGNHGKRDGIEDYIDIIGSVLGERGIVVKTTEDLVPNAVNLVIDEFTNSFTNRKIAKAKTSHPETRLIYVLTEFVSRKYCVESFNHFGNLMDSAIISVFEIVVPYKRNDFLRPGWRSYLKAAFFLPLVFFNLLYIAIKKGLDILRWKGWSSPLTQFLADNHRLLYFHLRYLGLKSYLGYADAIVLSHEKVIDGIRELLRPDQQVLGVIYPQLQEDRILERLLIEKKPFIEVTGSITSHREKWIKIINNQIICSGVGRLFHLCKTFSFLEKTILERAAFSLHPPQTKNWRYSSPTRIHRALSVDFNLPVLTNYFGQTPIEDVCFVINNKYFFEELYEMYVDRDKLISFLAPRISKYNEIVKERNDRLVEGIKHFCADMYG